ncbi:hypothetical protein P171DRAFT_443917 [Karstenula rhodostoma CBS 690.94]|uniref:F-box domain-containing protein n=1 Tax=Karstenula rhodostoma CBS 690.94 TaxID=1392251 RepID=A0A9P4PJB1_9PLEO|nr:hypothetical protein P171DRAFT_443917 [Karstenula rhodostoma CBS 690.94]
MGVNLPDLPTELLQQIAEHARVDDQITKDTTLHALRLTCKTIYAKTIHTFCTYHSALFKNAVFELSPKGLGTLLWMVSNRDFRDRFQTIELRSQEVSVYPFFCKDTGRSVVVGGEVYGFADQFYYIRDHWDAGNNLTDSRLVYYSQTEAIMRQEVMAYEKSPELYYTALHIFLELKKAENLSELVFTSAFDILLQALEDSVFGRPIAKVAVTQTGLLEGDWERTWNGVTGNTSFLASAFIQGPNHEWQTPAQVPYPSFISIVEVTRMVPTLELEGCILFPPFHRRRVCFGCREFWKTCFYRHQYPNLHSLHIHDFFVDGLQLRNFFKQHGSLTTLKLEEVKLTSGSWSKVLNVVQDAPIDTLRVRGLFQKQSEGNVRGSQDFFDRHSYAQINGDNVPQFLAQTVHNPSYLVGQRYRKVVLPAQTGVLSWEEVWSRTVWFRRRPYKFSLY